METVLIILAAGSSSRMGQPKQYLELDGKSLLERTIDIASESDFLEIVVVTGAYAESLIPVILSKEVHIVNNPGWKEGMGSSIREGVRYAFKKFNPSFLGITVIDQPYLEVSLLNKLLEKAEKTHNISASKYGNGRTGVPACFPASWEKELMNFSGDRGARDILEHRNVPVEKVDFPKGMLDIDRPDDLTALEQR